MATVENTVQWRWIWQLDGQDHAVSVVHLNPLAPGLDVDSDAADGLLLNLNDAFSVTTGGHVMEAQISNNFQIGRCTLRDISVENQAEHSSTLANPVVGTNTSDPLPLQTALVTTFRTALAGRSYRGRWYGLGYAEGTNTSLGVAQPALITAQQGMWAHLRAVIQVSGWRLCVASHTLGTSLPVISHDTNTRWDTQRRRAIPGI